MFIMLKLIKQNGFSLMMKILINSIWIFKTKSSKDNLNHKILPIYFFIKKDDLF